MYKFRLKECRQNAGFKTQKDIAEHLGIKERKYASWEREEVAMTLKDACIVAKALGCTPNDLAGWPKEKGGRAFVDERQADVNEWYEGCSESQRSFIAQSARNAYESEKKSESAVHTEKREAV